MPLALTSGCAASILRGQDHGHSYLERQAASASGTGGPEEPLTFLRGEEEQQPCWATEKEFTLSCSFKTTARQGGHMSPQFGPGARAEAHRACLERRMQHKGTLPIARSTAQPDRYRGSC